MIWTCQAPFPSHTYRAVLQLSHALGEKKHPLAFSFDWRTILSLPPSSPCTGRLGRQLPAGTGAAPWRGGGTRSPTAKNPLGCRLTRCRRGQEHKGLGLQTLNGVKLYAAPAEMIAPLVVEENCTRLDLKASELLTAAGRNESLVGRGYLWKGRPPLAGARIRSHSCRVGKRHCWTTAVVIHRVCFHTAPHVPYTYGTMCGDCQGNESTTKASAN